MTEAELVDATRAATLKAYAPDSQFQVGRAVESVGGEVVTGANVENARFRLGSARSRVRPGAIAA